MSPTSRNELSRIVVSVACGSDTDEGPGRLVERWCGVAFDDAQEDRPPVVPHVGLSRPADQPGRGVTGQRRQRDAAGEWVRQVGQWQVVGVVDDVLAARPDTSPLSPVSGVASSGPWWTTWPAGEGEVAAGLLGGDGELDGDRDLIAGEGGVEHAVGLGELDTGDRGGEVALVVDPVHDPAVADGSVAGDRLHPVLGDVVGHAVARAWSGSPSASAIRPRCTP